MKRILARVLSLTLVIVVFLGAVAPVASAYSLFKDVPTNSPAFTAIYWAHQNGIVTGADGMFLPEDNMTREQYALILYRYEGRPSPGAVGGFPDVEPSRPGYNAVSWAHNNGIVTGLNGRFLPDDNMTRAQMVLMMFRYNNLKRRTSTSNSNALNSFSDRNEVPAPATAAMRWAVTHGLVTGTGDGRLLPNAPITRAQVVLILHRYINRFVSPTPAPVFYHPLTGAPTGTTLLRDRPIAITLGNTTDALPMNGISQADIIYEVLVEGGLTRMLAIYQDISDVGRVGSIRSARPYTVQIADSFDAIFVSVGGSPQGYDEIRARGVTHIDELYGRFSGFFRRERDRIPGRIVDNYHSVVTTGELATQLLPVYSARDNFRLRHNVSYVSALSFVDNGTPAGGRSANSVVVRFSGGKTSTFNYNAEEKTYYMRQFNTDFSDANDEEKPAFTNLIIIRTSVVEPPDWGSNRLDIRTTGSGTGYFVCGGRYVEINWSRADMSSQFIYTLKDGSPLNLGRGKTYIAIIPDTRSATFS